MSNTHLPLSKTLTQQYNDHFGRLNLRLSVHDHECRARALAILGHRIRKVCGGWQTTVDWLPSIHQDLDESLLEALAQVRAVTGEDDAIKVKHLREALHASRRAHKSTIAEAQRWKKTAKEWGEAWSTQRIEMHRQSDTLTREWAQERSRTNEEQRKRHEAEAESFRAHLIMLISAIAIAICIPLAYCSN
jgi:hypothetical protein